MKRSWLMVFGSLLSSLFAAACGSDDGGGNGGPPAQTPAGQEFEGVALLADQVIGSNEEAYAGLDFASGALESVFGSQTAPAASTKQSVEGCIPPDLQNATFEYDPASQTYTSTQVPGAPPGGLRVFIYDVSSGAPDTSSNIGYLDVTCSGTLPNFSLVAILNVDGVDVLNVNANATLSTGSYQLTLNSGFLTDATGSEQIDLDPGAGGGQFFGSETGFNSNFGVSFIVGERTSALLSRSLNVDNVDASFNEEHLFIDVFKLGDSEFSIYDFEFTAFDIGGTPGAPLSGVGTFFLLPELGGGGGIDAVVCFEGTFENMNVSAATESCALGYTILPLSSGDVDAIERGYQGLQRMYAAVEGVTTTAASIGLAALSTQ